MIAEFVAVLAGVAVIVLLSEVIIKNSIELAKHYGISGTFIGLTVLSIGTSIPEIMTAIIGSIDILRYPEQINTLSSLIIGANTGSSIFQQNVIIPIVALLGAVVIVKKNLFATMGALIGATTLAWVFATDSKITRLEGLILFLAYGFYLIYLKKNKISESLPVRNHLSKKMVLWSLMLLAASFLIMSLVTNEVLKASVIIIETLTISASFFGVILLGIASALPELTTALIAVKKQHRDITSGILIGSSITNPLIGLGLGALISSYTVPSVIIIYDLPLKIATAALIYFFFWKKHDLNKREAVILIILFVVYLFLRNMFFPADILN